MRQCVFCHVFLYFTLQHESENSKKESLIFVLFLYSAIIFGFRSIRFFVNESTFDLIKLRIYTYQTREF